MQAETNIQQGWDFVFNKLFNQKTKLIYEYVTDESENGAFAHLPTKEEIARHYPNPCGWYTGMEDGDINGGIMLEAVMKRYAVTKEKSMKKYADDLYEGLILNATLSKEKGFLIRSRLPEDGVTHYINSSRDQYTHWIESMTHFYFSELSDELQREEIKGVLVEFAKKAERDVTKENSYCLLDELGAPALVCSMYGEMYKDDIMWHETCRLPMFYMAAYVVTKDSHWLEKYRSVRDWGLTTAEDIKIEPRIYEGVFALMQMQISVRYLYDYETECEYKARYGALMKKVASSIDWYLDGLNGYFKDYVMPKTVKPWREVPKEFIFEKNWSLVGRQVLHPHVWLASSVDDVRKKLRNGSESIITQALCPNYQISQSQLDAFMDVVQNVSLESPFGYIATGYCLAWWSLKKLGRV